jgi:hypothetical protein
MEVAMRSKNFYGILFLATFIVGISLYSYSAEHITLPADKMLKMATDKAKEEDPKSSLSSPRYSVGDRDLNFRRGEFVFYSPALAAKERRSGLSVRIDNGKIKDVRKVGCRKDSPDVDFKPHKAVQAALRGQLGPWWNQNQEARLYVELVSSRAMASASKERSQKIATQWLWDINASGPGLPEDFITIVDASSFSIVSEKKKPISKEFQKIKEEDMEKAMQDLQKKFNKKK